MRVFGSLFFGIVSTFLLFALWTAGEPPAVSFFWKTENLTIIGHETEDWDSGWGVVDRTLPIVERSSAEAKHPTAMLHVEDQITDQNAIIENWPIGLTVNTRLHPSERFAYPASTWPFMTVPAFGFTTILLFFVAYQIHRRFKKSFPAHSRQGQSGSTGSAGWILALFLFLFTAVPLFLLIFAVNFGDPPPRSLIWPRETVEIVSSEARIFYVGNGTQAAYVDVLVKSPNDLNGATEPLKGTTYSSVSIPDAQQMVASQYRPGEVKTAMRSLEGDLYVVRFRLSDAFTFLAAILSLLCLFVVRTLWRIIT